jgi:hypothetical protein
MAGFAPSVFAWIVNCGYIVSRSYLSPLMAAWRLSAVEPTFTSSSLKYPQERFMPP